jgi:undecaprenyl-diphosphatase
MTTPASGARQRVDGDLLRDPRRGLTVAGLCLLAVVALTALVAVDRASPPALGGIDRWWRDLMQPPSSWARSMSEALKVLGSGVVMVPLRIVVGLWLLVRRRRADLAAWLLAWAAADLLTLVLKPAVGRVRPDLADAHSFPSAHAKTAAQVAVGLVLVFTSPWRSRAIPWALAVAWIVAMALSRTVLDEHWLSDVIAGSLVGTACAVGAGAIVQLRRDAARGDA